MPKRWLALRSRYSMPSTDSILPTKIDVRRGASASTRAARGRPRRRRPRLKSNPERGMKSRLAVASALSAMAAFKRQVDLVDDEAGRAARMHAVETIDARKVAEIGGLAAAVDGRRQQIAQEHPAVVVDVLGKVGARFGPEVLDRCRCRRPAWRRSPRRRSRRRSPAAAGAPPARASPPAPVRAPPCARQTSSAERSRSLRVGSLDVRRASARSEAERPLVFAVRDLVDGQLDVACGWRRRGGTAPAPPEPARSLRTRRTGRQRDQQRGGKGKRQRLMTVRARGDGARAPGCPRRAGPYPAAAQHVTAVLLRPGHDDRLSKRRTIGRADVRIADRDCRPLPTFATD